MHVVKRLALDCVHVQQLSAKRFHPEHKPEHSNRASDDSLPVCLHQAKNSTVVSHESSPSSSGDSFSSPSALSVSQGEVGEEDVDGCENYGQEKIMTELRACKAQPTRKPALSYIALIGLAIQSNPEKRLLLSDIYDWISENFPYFRGQDRSWQNSVRHNLSLNECFTKQVKSDGSKSALWTIHPANVADFAAGDYRRRRARRKARQADQQTTPPRAGPPPCNTPPVDREFNQKNDGYVKMTVITAKTEDLIKMFGEEAILGNPKKLAKLARSSSAQCVQVNHLKNCRLTSYEMNHELEENDNLNHTSSCQYQPGTTNYDGLGFDCTEVPQDQRKTNRIEERYPVIYDHFLQNEIFNQDTVKNSIRNLSYLHNCEQIDVDQVSLENGLTILTETVGSNYINFETGDRQSASRT